jgi:hypothetical protein
MVMLWLECNSTTTQHTRKYHEKQEAVVRRSCGWSDATTNTQQTKRTMKQKDESVEFSEQKIFTKTRRKNRLEMFVRMGRDDVFTWNWRWAAC